MIGIAALLAAGPAAAQGVDAAQNQIARVLFEDCAKMEEPLDDAARQCSEAIQTGKLSEAAVGEAFRFRGIIALRQGRYDDAMQDFNLSIQVAPEAGRTYYFKGLTFEAMGEDRRADGQYRNANLYAPEDPDVIAKMQERNLN